VESDMLNFWENKPPDHVNDLGVKWWLDKETTGYAQKPDIHGVSLPEVCAWMVQLPNGSYTRLLTYKGEVLMESQRLEDIGCRIDRMKVEESFAGMTTWRKMFKEVFQETGDTFDGVEMTLSEKDLDVRFDAGYGLSEGKAFTAWSRNYVYFPVVYDGAEWIDYVPRNPNGEATNHIGGQ